MVVVVVEVVVVVVVEVVVVVVGLMQFFIICSPKVHGPIGACAQKQPSVQLSKTITNSFPIHI